ISALRTSDGWVEGPANVREATVTFFRKHFDNVEWNRPVLEGLEFSVLSEERKGMLVSIFTMGEI
ncbi:hypothetical protein A2U01_0078418, partial [Trifolium medium]|nr:hypothetical protein [Trifolium medium]